MDPAPQDAILNEVNDSEELLWAGRPRQGFALRPADAFLIPFSILWGGFAIFWEVMAVVGGAPWFAALFGVPFVLMGLYLIAGRFWFDMWQRASTVYAVTSERVIIVSGIFSRQVKSLGIDTISDVSLTERSKGGTITFGTVPFMHAWYGAGWPGLGQLAVPSFELTEDARQVFQIILEARRIARRS